jgi:hypothetical protein
MLSIKIEEWKCCGHRENNINSFHKITDQRIRDTKEIE